MKVPTQSSKLSAADPEHRYAPALSKTKPAPQSCPFQNGVIHLCYRLSRTVAASLFLLPLDLGDQGVVAWVCDLRVRESVLAVFRLGLQEPVE